MSKTVPQREGNQISPPAAPSILPDVPSLRRLFDAEFPRLVEQARVHLGAAASQSTHVAEGALVRAWDARATLQTKEQLDAFLADDIRGGAERVLSRRGGQHPPVGSQTLDLPQSWAHVVHAIAQDPHAAQEAKDAAEAVRHLLAGQIVTATRGISWRIVAAIAVAVVVIAVAGVVVVDRISTERAINEAIAAPNGRVTVADVGQLARLTLPDGSRLQLAPESKLMVPAAFGGKIRAVKLDGAANIDVAPGQPGEFRVYLRNAIVAAHGTGFVISSYWADRMTVVLVREGSVDVSVGKQSHRLNAGGTLFIDSVGVTRAASTEEVADAGAWANGRLVLDKRPLRAVLPHLQRWYKINADVRDLSLLDRVVSVNAPLDSSLVAMAQVERSAGVRFVNDSGAVVVLDTAAVKPAAHR